MECRVSFRSTGGGDIFFAAYAPMGGGVSIGRWEVRKS